ncbi:protein kinase [Oculatella sp. LEGE 06141]|uniref:protein kinase domain-containing protein n=1 Tax=Oculatella sp. LEGE 06141 TaxID=1828648 RepID=UPI00187F1A80|nr:protein kinase [Oculatella sp. LEGE 06141]
MEGQLLDGRYHVIRALRAGGFGKTFIAEDTRRPGNPTCVVKQLKPASSDPIFLETARRLFQSEAESLEQLGHYDQIPRLLAFFEEDQEFYLVQEYIHGYPLTAELPTGSRWSEFQVVQFLHEVLGILEFVHSQGVIHRDVKPDNIIRRSADRKLFLVDFGAVKQVRSHAAALQEPALQTIAVGTPGYMPSEQGHGKPRPSSDIYALGMIGIQALTGINPNRLEDDLETGEVLWQQHVRVSPDLAAVLSKMVKCYFKERYTSAAEARSALEGLNHPAIALQRTAKLTYPPHQNGYRQANFQPRPAIAHQLGSGQVGGERQPSHPRATQPSQTLNQMQQRTIYQANRRNEASTRILLAGLTITTLVVSLGGIYASGVLEDFPNSPILSSKTVAEVAEKVKERVSEPTNSPARLEPISTPPITNPIPSPVLPPRNTGSAPIDIITDRSIPSIASSSAPESPRSASNGTAPTPEPTTAANPSPSPDTGSANPSPASAPEPIRPFELSLPAGYVYQQTGNSLAFTSSDGGFGGLVDVRSASEQLTSLQLEQQLKGDYESRFQEITWQHTSRKDDGRIGITWVGKDNSGNSLVATSYVEQHGNNVFMLSLFGINRAYGDYIGDAEAILNSYRPMP